MDIKKNLNDIVIQVILCGKCIGRMKWDTEKNLAVFQFTSEYLQSKINISPLAHNKVAAAFYGNKNDKYQGLPEFIADSLPDEWGNTLFNQWLNDNGISLLYSNPLLKLVFIGRRGIGALEYMPEINPIHDANTAIDIEELQAMANDIYNKKIDASVTMNQKKTLASLIELGTSVGGKHQKGIVARNRITGEFRSGQVELPPEYEYFIIKFQENPMIPTSEIEMVYHEMALNAGIVMMPCELVEINGSRHFMTKRFDRVKGEKLLSQTMAALAPNGNDYMHLFFLCETLKVPYKDKERLFRQIVFNHMAGVTDDHNKNFSFIMNKKGVWSLAPAYDVMFTANIWENPSAAVHCLGLAGKHSHVTVNDLKEFGKDFGIKKCDEIISQVATAIGGFKGLCEKYNVHVDWVNKISESLNMIFPQEHGQNLTNKFKI